MTSTVRIYYILYIILYVCVRTHIIYLEMRCGGGLVLVKNGLVFFFSCVSRLFIT